MGYIDIPGSPLADFTQAVISLWFRVPQASLDACVAGSRGDGSLFDGVIPLVVLGAEGSSAGYTTDKTSAVSATTSYPAIHFGTSATVSRVDYDFSGPPTYTWWVTQTSVWNPNTQPASVTNVNTDVSNSYASSKTPTTPTFIGVRASDATLLISFQTGKVGVAENYRFELSSIDPARINAVGDNQYTIGTDVVTWEMNSFLAQIGPAVVSGSATHVPAVPFDFTFEAHEHDTYSDISGLALNTTGTIRSDAIHVTPDVWHHVLISLNLQTIATSGSTTGGGETASYTSSASQLFVALDDVNQTGWDLSSNWVWGASDLNWVITDEALQVAGSLPFTGVTDPDTTPVGIVTYPVPTFSLASPAIPVRGKPMGLPAPAGYAPNIYKVEMAEFQLFTGVSRDTNVEATRRAFISAKGGPVHPAVAAKLLGKPPDIAFIKNRDNWIAGRNQGALPHVRAIPTGTIKPFTPDPRLGR